MTEKSAIDLGPWLIDPGGQGCDDLTSPLHRSPSRAQGKQSRFYTARSGSLTGLIRACSLERLITTAEPTFDDRLMAARHAWLGRGLGSSGKDEDRSIAFAADFLESLETGGAVGPLVPTKSPHS